MITRAVVVPHPPVLLDGVTGHEVAEVAELAAAARAAVDWALAEPVDRIVAVAAGEGGGRGGAMGGAMGGGGSWRPTPRTPGYLGERATATMLPLGLSVLATLLGKRQDGVRFVCVPTSAAPEAAAALGAQLAAAPEPTALLVAGDGSARRTLKAPGYLDERSFLVDAEIERALAFGDVSTLLALDVHLADELLIAGRAAWQVLAGALRDTTVEAALDYAGDPFGVWYAVARWRVTAPPPVAAA